MLRTSPLLRLVARRPVSSLRSFSDKSPTPLGTAYGSMTIGIIKEDLPLEARVAASPETVAKYVKSGFNVLVEPGAGTLSHFSDADYVMAGAKMSSNANDSKLDTEHEQEAVTHRSFNDAGPFLAPPMR